MSLYAEIPSFPNLTKDLCLKIEELAQLGLAREEILEGYDLEWDQLLKDEQTYFTQEYKRGRLRGKAEVARHLIKHSEGRNGLPATMAYLRRFASNYEKALDENGELTAENFHFIFNQ